MLHKYANISGFFLFWVAVIVPSIAPAVIPFFVVAVAISIITPETLETTDKPTE